MRFQVGDVVFVRFENQFGCVYRVNDDGRWPYTVVLFNRPTTYRTPPWSRLQIPPGNLTPVPAPSEENWRAGEYVPNELHRAVMTFVGPVAIEEDHGTEVQDR